METAQSKRGTTIQLRGNTWVYRAIYNYRQHYFPLSALKAKSLTMADEIRDYLKVNPVEAAIVKYNPRRALKNAPKPQRHVIPSIQELSDLFVASTAALNLGAATAKQYRTALLSFGKTLAKPGKDVDTVPVSHITKSAWSAFATQRLSSAKDEAEKLSFKRTLNSKLRGIRSLVAPNAVDHYEGLKQDWELSCLRQFYEEAKFFDKVGVSYRLPPEKLIVDTFDLIERTAACGDPLVASALLLALHGGLRSDEIVNCRIPWLDTTATPNRIWVAADGVFKPKGTQGFTEIRPDVLAKVRSLCVGQNYLLHDETEKRVEAVDKAVQALRANGWADYNKPLHELRKLFGSYVATTAGIFKAQKLLRHSNPNVTNQHYADVVLSEVLKSCWARPVPTA